MQVIKNIAAAAAVLSVVLVGGMSSASAVESGKTAQHAKAQDAAHSRPRCDVAGKFCNSYFGQ